MVYVNVFLAFDSTGARIILKLQRSFCKSAKNIIVYYTKRVCEVKKLFVRCGLHLAVSVVSDCVQSIFFNDPFKHRPYFLATR
jgi:hypothetical protein